MVIAFFIWRRARVYCRVVGGTFRTTVQLSLSLSVLVIFEIGFVMLLVVADKVASVKASRGDEVDGQSFTLG